MTDPHRRHTLKLMLAGAAAPLALKATAIDNAATRPAWRRGIEQQRQADAGNGTYRNPILAGDHPDPTILKDGRDYYMPIRQLDRLAKYSKNFARLSFTLVISPVVVFTS